MERICGRNLAKNESYRSATKTNDRRPTLRPSSNSAQKKKKVRRNEKHRFEKPEEFSDLMQFASHIGRVIRLSPEVECEKIAGSKTKFRSNQRRSKNKRRNRKNVQSPKSSRITKSSSLSKSLMNKEKSRKKVAEKNSKCSCCDNKKVLCRMVPKSVHLMNRGKVEEIDSEAEEYSWELHERKRSKTVPPTRRRRTCRLPEETDSCDDALVERNKRGGCVWMVCTNRRPRHPRWHQNYRARYRPNFGISQRTYQDASSRLRSKRKAEMDHQSRLNCINRTKYLTSSRKVKLGSGRQVPIIVSEAKPQRKSHTDLNPSKVGTREHI
ncbi:hypothetical protein AB6A40_009242 [Gnathostoma spinigerum]|uniref:Uncharacterized protein n=1 Tax=Gnathostoma spinigerum TaxID=75299 RepID=A0ABD6ERS4_9BILA